MNNTPIHALAGVITEKFILSAPQQAARALESLATHEILLLVSGLKAQTLVVCLNEMQPAKAAAVLRRMPLKQTSYILARLNVPQAAKLMQEFAAPYRARLSAVLEPAFVEMLQQAIFLPPDSAGAKMQTDFVAVRTDVKLGALVERLKNLPRKKVPAVCVVTDKDGVLKGIIRTAELSFYSTTSLAGSVMSPCEGVAVAAQRGDVLPLFTAQEIDMLPVVDGNSRCVGVVSRIDFLTEQLPAKQPFWKKLTH